MEASIVLFYLWQYTSGKGLMFHALHLCIHHDSSQAALGLKPKDC